jgi:vacuolar-type H+-ATPase catalytic subunit A/Vma1
MNRLEKLNISIASEFEKKMIVEYKQIKLYGYFDCMDKNNVYEFKCISELKKENYLQLAIYMFMNERKKQEDRNNMEETNYYLYNIFSDEWIQIKSNLQKLEKMMDIIIDYKLNEGNHISDEIFIENANHIVKKYF